MTDEEELNLLKAERDRLIEEMAKKPKSSKKRGKASSGFNLEPFKRPDEETRPTSAPWLAKNIATGLSSLADIPLLPVNLGLYAAGKKGFKYPSERLRETIEENFPSTKPQSGFQENIEPYIQGVSSIPGFGALGQLKHLGKLAPYIQGMGKFSAPNVAGTLGAIGGANILSNAAPESKIAPLAGSFLGSTVGRKVSRIKPSKAYEWVTDSSAKAAIRDPEVGNAFIKDVPYSLGASEIMSKTHQGAGKHVQSGLSKFLDKKRAYWGEETARVKEPLLSNPELSHVDISAPITWSINKLNAIDDPLIKKQFMESPLGRQTLDVLGLPAGTSAKKFMDVINKNPDIINRRMNFDDAWAYRKSIDNTISKKGWAGLGSQDEKELTQFRRHIDNTLGDTFERVSPEAYSDWKDYKKRYDSYLNREKTPILEITKEKHHPTKIYESAIQETGKLDSHAEVTLRSLKGKDRQYFAESIIRDLGRDGDKYSLPVFYNNFNNKIESPVFKRLLLNSLPSQMRKNIKEQLDIFEGVANIREQPKNLAGTFIYNQPSLTTRQKMLKFFKKKAASQKFDTPEGRRKLIDVALKNADHEPVMVPQLGADSSLSLGAPQAIKGYAASQAKRGNQSLDEDDELSKAIKRAESLGIDVSDLTG